MANVDGVNRVQAAEQIYKGITISCCKSVAVEVLMKYSQDFIDKVEDVVYDQNQYNFEIDEILSDMKSEEEKIDKEIKELQEEVDELMKKQEDGTITETELKKLNSIIEKTNSLQILKKEKSISGEEKIDRITENASSESKMTLLLSRDFGETTVEKGQELAETKVEKSNWYRDLFGVTKRQERTKALGEKAIAVGNELLDKTNNADNIVDKKSKK